jgi:hypothetical protein
LLRSDGVSCGSAVPSHARIVMIYGHSSSRSLKKKILKIDENDQFQHATSQLHACRHDPSLVLAQSYSRIQDHPRQG